MRSDPPVSRPKALPQRGRPLGLGYVQYNAEHPRHLAGRLEILYSGLGDVEWHRVEGRHDPRDHGGAHVQRNALLDVDCNNEMRCCKVITARNLQKRMYYYVWMRWRVSPGCKWPAGRRWRSSPCPLSLRSRATGSSLLPPSRSSRTRYRRSCNFFFVLIVTNIIRTNQCLLLHAFTILVLRSLNSRPTLINVIMQPN